MKVFLLGVAMGSLAIATAANAVVIVQYSQVGKAKTLKLTNSGANFNVATIGSPKVTITLNDPFSNTTVVAAGKFTFTGTGIAIATIGGSVATQLISSGSFSLQTTMPVTLGSYTGTNVLSGNFVNGYVTAILGSNTPQISVNAPTATFSSITSDFFSDPHILLDNFSITTSGALPSLGLISAGGGNQKLRNFSSSSTGTFDASIVPEPASWAFVVIGFGLVGVVRRRRRAVIMAEA